MREETTWEDIEVDDSALSKDDLENIKNNFKNHLQFLYKKHLLPQGNRLEKIFSKEKCHDAVVRVIYDRVGSRGQHYINKLEDNYLCKDIMISI